MIRVPLTKVKYALTGCYGGVWGDEPNGFDEIVVVRVADFDRTKGVVRVSEASTKRTVLVSHRNNRVLNRGDLLLEKSGGGEVTPVGSVVRFDYDSPAVSSNFIARLPVKRSADSRYLAYVFQDLFSRGVNEAHIKQTSGIQNIDVSSYLCERAWLPNSGTQRDVANYLDAKTAAIDALIAKKEELLAVLDRYRQAVITKAVTCPEGEFHSGEQHIKLKRLFKERSQKGFRNEEVLAATQHAGVVPKKFLDFKTMESMKEDWEAYKLVCPDDFVISLRSFEGGLEHSAYRGVISPAYTVLTPSPTVYPLYFRYVLKDKTFVSNLGLHKKGIRDGQAVPWTDLKDDVVWLPSFKAQVVVAAFVTECVAAIRTLADKCEAQVLALKQYRASVISAAVTGQSAAPRSAGQAY